ncbi:MAG: hypothetical protein IKX50_07365 [Spirochaetia bacterium]|nr:hypothetical protein [Spirochaetia bacterium]
MIDMTIPDELLIELLKESVEECYEKDNLLIERSMEQASVARIFYYMQNLINNDARFACLKDYNLDCEYNKNGQNIKATPHCENGTRPDMILHERGTNNHNLLIVEFKSDNGARESSGTSNDLIKLKDFTSQDIYNYQLGVFIKLLTEKPNYSFFKNGKEL